MLTTTVPFVLRGATGDIRVEIEPGWQLGSSTPPGVQGEALDWLGRFPTCTATISHPARGYDAMCGWVQFVRSSDSAQPDVFEMDPLPFTADLELPYCWFGTRPTLFDGPSRPSRQDLTWRAHSFLCASPTAMDRSVEPLAGFSWGFDVIDADIRFVAPAELPTDVWAEHLPVLGESFPQWTFSPGRSVDGGGGGRS